MDGDLPAAASAQLSQVNRSHVTGSREDVRQHTNMRMQLWRTRNPYSCEMGIALAGRRISGRDFQGRPRREVVEGDPGELARLIAAAPALATSGATELLLDGLHRCRYGVAVHRVQQGALRLGGGEGPRRRHRLIDRHAHVHEANRGAGCREPVEKGGGAQWPAVGSPALGHGRHDVLGRRGLVGAEKAKEAPAQAGGPIRGQGLARCGVSAVEHPGNFLGRRRAIGREARLGRERERRPLLGAPLHGRAVGALPGEEVSNRIGVRDGLRGEAQQVGEARVEVLADARDGCGEGVRPRVRAEAWRPGVVGGDLREFGRHRGFEQMGSHGPRPAQAPSAAGTVREHGRLLPACLHSGGHRGRDPVEPRPHAGQRIALSLEGVGDAGEGLRKPVIATQLAEVGHGREKLVEKRGVRLLSSEDLAHRGVQRGDRRAQVCHFRRQRPETLTLHHRSDPRTSDPACSPGDDSHCTPAPRWAPASPGVPWSVGTSAPSPRPGRPRMGLQSEPHAAPLLQSSEEA